MVKAYKKERQQDIEERFRFVKLEDYRNKNFNVLSNIDTLEYQYHTSNEDFELLKQIAAEQDRLHAPFNVTCKSFEKDLRISSNSKANESRERDSKTILIDLFQRLKSGPKVTRQNSNDRTHRQARFQKFSLPSPGERF